MLHTAHTMQEHLQYPLRRRWCASWKCARRKTSAAPFVSGKDGRSGFLEIETPCQLGSHRRVYAQNFTYADSWCSAVATGLNEGVWGLDPLRFNGNAWRGGEPTGREPSCRGKEKGRGLDAHLGALSVPRPHADPRGAPRRRSRTGRRTAN